MVEVGFDTVSAKLPSISVTAALAGFPFSTTVAPMAVSFISSKTTPVTLCCAIIVTDTSKQPRNKIILCFIKLFPFY